MFKGRILAISDAPYAIGTPYEKGCIPCTKLYRDEHAFDVLDKDKAYLLGFLFADGTLRMFNGYHELSIELVDENIIQKLKETMKSEHNISKRTRGGEQRKSTYTLRVGGVRTMGPKLEEYGMSVHGKYNYSTPNIPQEHVLDFIMGYFDGNGSVTIDLQRGAGYIQSGIKGPLNILEYIKDNLEDNGIHSAIFSEKGISRDKLYVLHMARRSSVLFYEKMYTNRTLFLERKKVKFEQYMDLKLSQANSKVKK